MKLAQWATRLSQKYLKEEINAKKNSTWDSLQKEVSYEASTHGEYLSVIIINKGFKMIKLILKQKICWSKQLSK